MISGPKWRVIAAAVVSTSVVLLHSSLAGQTSVFGLRIPDGDAKLYFDEKRLTAAKQWFAKNRGSWAPRRSLPAPDNAFLYLMTGNAAAAKQAIDWASNTSFLSKGPGNEARWYGEYQILVFSWLKHLFTPEQRKKTIESINQAIANDLRKDWGGAHDPANNFNWGFTRNALLWGMASYHEDYVDAQGRRQREIATTFLEDALVRRWQKVTAPFYSGTGQGGTLPEGSHYGPYLLNYFAGPLVQTRLFGRPLSVDTNFFKEAVLGVIHSTTPKRTHGSHSRDMAPRYQVFAYGDEQDNEGFPGPATIDYGNFMTFAAQEWSTTQVGQHARYWLRQTQPDVEPWFRAADAGFAEKGTPFETLPLDYFAKGPGYLYTRDTWKTSSSDKPTVMLFQLGQVHGSHAHCDAGTFQILRNDRWLTRETPGRSVTYADHTGTGTISDMTVWAHNGVTVNYHRVGEYCGDPRRPPPQILRVESQPTHAYAAVDLTRYHGIPGVSAIVREFVHVRQLNSLVTLDRVRAAQGAPRTVLIHFQSNPAQSGNVILGANGSEELRVISLAERVAGQTVKYTVIDESAAGRGAGGTWRPQHRLQIDTLGGAPETYLINVFQARSSGDSNLEAMLTEMPQAFTVSLRKAGSEPVTITFNKGMTSTGGSMRIGEASTPFSAGIQSMVVGEHGPVWAGRQP